MTYLHVEIFKGDDNIYVTRCPELDIYAHGDTQREAVAKIKKEIHDFLEHSDASIQAKQDINFTAHYYSSRLPRTH